MKRPLYNRRSRSRKRVRPRRLGAIVERVTKSGILSVDAAFGVAAVSAVLFIALVWYDERPSDSDSHTLLAARDTLAGSADLNWSADLPIETWDGVSLDLHSRRVTKLTLPESRLTGTISPKLGTLSDPTHLDLRGNRLSGAIPAELGQLVNLKALYLHDNRLSGTLPTELGDLSNLERLWLSNNRLTGPIPPELGRLSHLQELKLRNNRLDGCLPEGLRDVETSDLVSLGLPFCEES